MSYNYYLPPDYSGAVSPAQPSYSGYQYEPTFQPATYQPYYPASYDSVYQTSPDNNNNNNNNGYPASYYDSSNNGGSSAGYDRDGYYSSVNNNDGSSYDGSSYDGGSYNGGSYNGGSYNSGSYNGGGYYDGSNGGSYDGGYYGSSNGGGSSSSSSNDGYVYSNYDYNNVYAPTKTKTSVGTSSVCCIPYACLLFSYYCTNYVYVDCQQPTVAPVTDQKPITFPPVRTLPPTPSTRSTTHPDDDNKNNDNNNIDNKNV